MTANDITFARTLADNFSKYVLGCVLRDIAGDDRIPDEVFDIFVRALAESMKDSEE